MTEKSLKYLIEQYAGKIKRLQGELAGAIGRKKGAEASLREAKEKKAANTVGVQLKKLKRWRKEREKKAAKPYPVEKIVEKILKKATKKKA